MKTISKRIISVFLSAVMVITMLPAFAITAFAADTNSKGLVGSYLSSDVTTGIKTNSNVIWDDDEKAAYFSGNESYLLLEGTPMKSVSAESGFAVSFDIKRGDNNGAMCRALDFSNGTNASTFAVNAGANDNYERYVTLAKPSGSEIRYYANDFTNTTYCDPAASSNWLDEEKSNVWYNITVSMSPSGQYSYYIDGELKATFKADYYTTQTNAVTPEAIMNAFSGFSTYCIGTSVYQLTGTDDGYFNGYIKNLKLYDCEVDVTQAFAGDASSDIATLKAAIKEYESRMDGAVYLNMGKAYEAYVTACKAYDSYYYGGNTSVDIKTAAANLAKEAMKMHAWRYVQPTFVTASYGSTDDSSYTDMLNYYKNVLYGETCTSDSAANTSLSKVKYYMRAPSVTLLYDGITNPQTAIMIALDGNNGITSKSARYVLYASNSTSNFNLNGYWHGSSDTGGSKTWNFTGTIHSDEVLSNVSSEFSNFQIARNAVSNYNYERLVSNLLVFDENTDWNGNSLLEVNPSVYIAGSSNATDHDTDISATLTGNTAIRVINYKVIREYLSQSDYKETLKNVSQYKEGGLTSLLSAYNLATDIDLNTYFNGQNNYTDCAAAIDAAVNAFANVTAANTDTQSNYPALRTAFDTKDVTLSKFVENGDNELFSVIGAYNNGVRKGFSENSYSAFKTAYEAAQNVMSPVYADGYVQGSAAATAAEALLNAFNALEPVSVKAPSLTESCYLGPEDSIQITNNESGSTVYYTIEYNDGSTSQEKQYNDGDVVKPFDGSTTFTTATVTAHSSLNGDDSKNVSATYTLLKAPSFSVADNQIITEKNEVSISSNNSVESTLQYSYDGTNWNDYTDPFAPFKENDTTSVNIYAREVYANATSAVVNVTNLIRKATFGIYSSTGTQYYDKNSIITIVDAKSYSDDIMYTLKIDGVSDTNIYTYDKENGIIVADNDDFKNAKILEITAYAMSQSNMDDQKITAKFYNSDNYSPLAYQETFDYGSVNGTAFDGVIQGTLSNSNSASFVDGAGSVDSSGNSSDWRNNVLKINTNATAPGNRITLNTNPLSTVTNSAIAKSAGVTISFWRHIEDADGNTVTFTQEWLNCISFYNSTNSNLNFSISANGYTKHNASAGNYIQIKPQNQDPTKHAAGNDSGYWVQVAVSIDPENGVTVYTNGEPHDTDVTVNGYTGNNAAIAKEILAFITDSNTSYSLCNGGSDQGNNYSVYLDDIRMYSTVLSQLDIVSMYTDINADIATKSSTGHDPTAVTVYTLTNGTQVGIEYIEKNNIDESRIADIDYYIFGTGMTIYHSDDNVSWEVVGDSSGRCGYQNEDLFGAPYTTALSEALEYAKTDDRDGAGYLVWAPHVMYNVTTNKWCYYGSTSSWGSTTSAIFFCESNNITGPYTYKQIVFKSAGHPNAIDPCVYYDKDFTNLYMVYGSWGWANGNQPIYVRTLSADGSDLNNGAGTLLCRGIDTSLEPDSSDSASGEGAYVVYDKNTDYYYLYVSYGQNSGSYVERVYRSKSPNKDFVGVNGIEATDNTTTGTHGNQILSPFDIPIYNYTYVSTGHNSVYKVKNKKGEYVTVNSVHARPLANEKNGWIALEDGALATRQSDVTGNVSLQNMIAYTEDGWPVMFPYQYNGTDTATSDITAKDLEGVYLADDMQLNVSYNWSTYYRYTMLAISETEGISYGTRDNGEIFRFNFELSKGSDGTNYVTIYTDDTKTQVVLRGVVASHTEWIPSSRTEKTIYQFGLINESTGEYTWAYRSGDIPTVDQESAGNMVSSSGVIYTHLANDTYTKYGQEISDDYLYGTDQHQGERCTTISVKYPYYIDTSNDGAVYCLSDEEKCKEGNYTGGNYRVTELNDGMWVDSNGMRYSDDQASLLSSDEQADLTKVYGLKGTVSNYFKYNEDTGKYTDSGVQLVVTYTKDGFKSYGEYLFLYVMPNPAIAHTIVGMRNTHDGGVGTDTRASALVYTRFNGSDGLATDIRSDVTFSANTDRTDVSDTNNNYTTDGTTAPVLGTGSFNYLGYFGNSASLEYPYTTPQNIADSFTFYDKTVGVNAGSYGSAEHSNHKDYAYTMTSNVVDVDYYIDYSDKNNSLITYNNGVPSGYSFDFVVSNLNWNPKQNKGNAKSATSYYRNSTGLTANTSLITYDEANSVRSDNTFNSISNEETLGYGDPSFGRKVLSGYYDDEANYNDDTYKTGLTKAFDYVDTGWSDNNAWQGKITLSGKDSVAKNTDTSSAEKYANFIYEKGSYQGNGSAAWSPSYYGGEETYSYYNIGVNTCDKGAVREFAETFINKQMKISYDSDGNISGIDFVTDDNGKPLDIESGDYSVASYKEYLNAIAEAYWFVENPYNTTYVDEETGEIKEYTTAYAVKQGENHALVNANETGNDIFETGTTFTDPVQAQIIKNVITAYDNLFTKAKYNASKILFDDVKNMIELPEVQGDYTTESVNRYKEFINRLEANYNYYQEQDQPEEGKEYWRYVDLTGSEYITLNEMLEAIENSLMPIVDTSLLTPVIEEKTPVAASGIYDDAGNQIVSYGSWKDLYDEVVISNDLITQSNDADKLISTESKTYELSGETYEIPIIPDDIEANYTQLQKDVNSESEVLKAKELSQVDTDDAYVSFDNVVEIVNGLDRNKYTDEALAELDALVKQLSEVDVYNKADSDLAALYNDLVGADAIQMSDNATLKVTALNETDTLTASLLSLINTFNDVSISADDANANKYVKRYKAEFTVQIDGEPVAEKQTTLKYYGDMFSFDAQSVLEAAGKDVTDNTIVNWSATLYDGTQEVAFETADVKGSQKVSAYTGTNLQRKADTNVAVVANFVSGEMKNTYRAEIYDVYGKLIDVIYTDSISSGNYQNLTINGNDINAKVIPFYNFNYFEVSEPDENSVVTVKPIYTPETSYTIKVQEGGSISGKAVKLEDGYKAEYDAKVIVKNESIDNFYAWAVKTSDGDYQVASYSSTYSFYACADEEYVAITKLDGTYSVDGIAITADIIENGATENNTADITDDEFVVKKLDAQAPFTSIQNSTMTSDHMKARVFVRVTEGAKALTGYGIVYKSGETADPFKIGDTGAYSRAIDNMLSTGQYVVTLSSSKGFTRSVSFRSYINYDFEYKFEGVNEDGTPLEKTSNINAIDYSNISVAKLA